MAHDVPIATEDGSHGTGVFRANLYVLKNGQEGLSDPTDGLVTAMDVPTNQVQAAPANYTIINRAAGYPKEMYSGRLQTIDRVSINPTTSTGGRSDLIVFRVENPATEAWQPLPDDQKLTGPYVRTVAIPNVAAGTTSVRDVPGNYSAITLARVDIPPSTSAITNAMITDLRATSVSPISAPSEFYDIVNYASSSTLPPPPSGSGTRTTNYQAWPAGASWQVPVPGWATQAACTFEVNPLIFDNTFGDMRIMFNGRALPAVTFDVNFPYISGSNPCYFWNGGGMRVPYKTGGKISVLPTERGKTVTVSIQARSSESSSHSARGSSTTTSGSLGEITIRFKQSSTAA
jgi:hypothetical protein